MGDQLKSQDIGLLQAVNDAVSALHAQGTPVNVKVKSVVTEFPDGSIVIFNADDNTPETDWHIVAAGPTFGQ
jgi:hypothetical protein